LSTLLRIEGLAVSYGSVPAVDGVDLEIEPGELRVILGANGAGKTTIIKTIMGLLKPKHGTISFDGEHDLLRLRPDQIHRLGIAWVPEGRQLWHTMTVLDNLRMGAFEVADENAVNRRIAEMFERFPRLGERRHQLAGSLSGGEQQMVAIARALVSSPRLLLMDEPSLGLAPLVIAEIFKIVADLNRDGTTIFLVEQNANMALKVAHHFYLMEQGRVTFDGTPGEIAEDEVIQRAYLGTRRATT
jgi:branched-chain amino acid transport system ATP-binding protein